MDYCPWDCKESDTTEHTQLTYDITLVSSVQESDLTFLMEIQVLI